MGKSSKNGPFSMAMLNNQMVCCKVCARPKPIVQADVRWFQAFSHRWWGCSRLPSTYEAPKISLGDSKAGSRTRETQQAENRSCSPWQSSSNLGACHVKRLVKAHFSIKWLVFPKKKVERCEGSDSPWYAAKCPNCYGPRMVMEEARPPHPGWPSKGHRHQILRLHQHQIHMSSIFAQATPQPVKGGHPVAIQADSRRS